MEDEEAKSQLENSENAAKSSEANVGEREVETTNFTKPETEASEDEADTPTDHHVIQPHADHPGSKDSPQDDTFTRQPEDGEKRPHASEQEDSPVRPPIARPESFVIAGSREQNLDQEDDQVDGSAIGEDEVDRMSLYSLYMTQDFRYYFQHPYARLTFAYLVTFCNFLVYAEDPVAHSEKECFIPVVGNCFSFVATRYPTNAWAFLKVFMWVAAIIIGIVIGKIIVHNLLFNRLFRLKMFNQDQGSWMTMFFTSIVALFIVSWLYNGFLKIGGDSTVEYEISEKMGIKNSFFMKAAATGTWCGDFFTAWMVTDIMLQEKLYPHWGKPARRWWNRNYHRIILFWIMVVLTSGIVLMVIITDWIKWDFLNRDFITSNEFSRGILASFILVMDLLIVMQDWDFPHFVNNFDVKMPGVNTAHFIIEIPKLLNPERWKIHISGKWFNYGIIFIVMLLDLNMWKNQIFYSPYEYGQYTSPEGRIITIKDDYSLETFNETEINYEWRSTTINPTTNLTYLEGDLVMNSRYVGYSLALKSIAFVPCLLSFLCFGIMVWYFGRWKPTKKDYYAGRLKKRCKRPKRRSLFNRSIASIQNGVDLMRFSKRKGNTNFDELDVGSPETGPRSQQDVPV